MRIGLFPSRSKGVLTDGRRSLPYAGLPAAFAHIDAALQAAGVSRRDVVGFEARNVLSHALAVLHLLHSGYGVYLFSERRSTRRGPHALPAFCRHRLTVLDRDRDAAEAPAIQVAPNPAWDGRRRSAGERLYLPTSGSTGAPKVAVHERGRLLGNVTSCVGRFSLTARDRVALPVPIGHMYGLGAALLPAVAAGASVDVQDDANVLRFLAREAAFSPTVAFLTPAFCEGLLAVKRSAVRYRLTITAGDRIRGETFLAYEERFGPLANLYGSTELGAIATSETTDPPGLRTSAVRLMPRVRVCPAAGTSRAATARGVRELHLRHAYGFVGYVDERGRRSDPFRRDADRCFRTRDLARVLPGGRLAILGRADHCVNRAGVLVACADVEEAVRGVAGVRAAAVVPHGTVARGGGLVAFCAVGPDRGPSAAEIRALCRHHLAAHAVPDRVVVLPELPRLESGKVDRPRLVRMAAHG